jgi:hypothetical protein
MSFNDKLIKISDLCVIYEEIKKKNLELEKNIEAIEISKTEQTRKGYDTVGFKYQYLCNILNDVIGSNHWEIVSEIISNIQYTRKTGYGDKQRDQNYYNVCIKTTLKIGNWLVGDGGSFFEILDQKSHYGDGTSITVGDAVKGATTNAIKKTMALCGLGESAFTGQLALAVGRKVTDEDYISIPDETIDGNTNQQSGITPFYNPANPYETGQCHQSGQYLSDTQIEYCKKNKIRPTSLPVIQSYKGNMHELKLTPEEIKAAGL